MSVITHRHLYCDLCDEPYQHEVLGRDPIRMQRQKAKEHDGWISVIVGRKWYDVCGRCVANISRSEICAIIRIKKQTGRT